MKYLLKNIHLWEYGVNDYPVEDRSFVGVFVNFTIGPSDSDGGTDYELFICTPKWLAKEVEWRKAIWGRNLLIVERFEEKLVVDAIKEALHNLDGIKNVEEIIAKYAAWEFEDYSNSESR